MKPNKFGDSYRVLVIYASHLESLSLIQCVSPVQVGAASNSQRVAWVHVRTSETILYHQGEQEVIYLKIPWQKSGPFWLNIIICQIKTTIDCKITYHFMYHSWRKYPAINYSSPLCQLHSLIKDVQMLKSVRHDTLWKRSSAVTTSVWILEKCVCLDCRSGS